MPKVPEGYEEQRRRFILDTAQELCIRRPAYEVTMRDIIRETKLSPGSIYRHFSDMDEVLISLLNRTDGDYQLWRACEPLLASGQSVNGTITGIFHQIGLYLGSTIAGSGKISFELNIRMVNDPEFFRKVQAELTEVSDYDRLMQHTMEYLSVKVEEGVLKPLIPLSDIFTFAVAAMDGIVRDLILTKCYSLPTEAMGLSMDEMKLTNTLARSLLSLLNEG
jgi:AcrR family transcriptional regulator